MNLQELKRKTPAELLAFAEELEIENASSLRKQDMLFAILKQLAENDVPISGDGVLEVLSDGFGFLRSPEANYLPGPDDIYVSPSQVRRFGLRTGDTVEGQIRSPRDGERYFALLKVNLINFDEPDRLRQRINFDNLTPLPKRSDGPFSEPRRISSPGFNASRFTRGLALRKVPWRLPQSITWNWPFS
jgi:transcription termination factor Rho